MKQRLILLTASVAFLFVALTIGTIRISAQQSAPTPGASAPTPTPDLERRVYRLEVEQTQNIEALNSSIETNRSLVTIFAGLFGLVVAIQGLVSFSQWRREGEREARQTRREGERDGMDQKSAKQVSDILDVVQRTLASRLDAEEKARKEAEEARKEAEGAKKALLAAAEKKAREEAKEAREELQKVANRLAPFEGFYGTFQELIKDTRKSIEEQASRLAGTARHEFRQHANELNSLARQFDIFKTQYANLEAKPHPEFSARIAYILGIAAHYANQPELAKQYLGKVAGCQQPEPGEDNRPYEKRVANAYYYLGVIESNFGNHDEAIKFFEKANGLDLDRKDFLTRVVTAEAYAMSANPDKAMPFLSVVEQEASKKERTEENVALRPLYH